MKIIKLSAFYGVLLCAAPAHAFDMQQEVRNLHNSIFGEGEWIKRERKELAALEKKREDEINGIKSVKASIDNLNKNIDSYNAVVAVIDAINKALGDGYEYYYHIANRSVAARDYKSVTDYLRKIKTETFYLLLTGNVYSQEEHQRFRDKMNKALTMARGVLEFVEKNTLGENGLINEFKKKIALFDQACEIAKRVNELVNGAYNRISSEYTEAVGCLIAIGKENHLSEYSERLPSILSIIQKTEEALKRKIALFDQASGIAQRVHELINGVYDHVSTEYKQAISILIEINKKKNLHDYSEKTLQTILSIIKNTEMTVQKGRQSQAELNRLEEERKQIYNNLSAEEKQEIDRLLKSSYVINEHVLAEEEL